MSDKLPDWVNSIEDKKLIGKAVAFEAPYLVLSDREICGSYVSEKESLKRNSSQEIDQPRKRSRSVEQTKSIIDQYPEFWEEFEDNKAKATELLKAKNELLEELLKAKNTLLEKEREESRLRSYFKTVVQTGSLTLVRSFVEIFLRTYEDKLWNEARLLVTTLFGEINDHPLNYFDKTLLLQGRYLALDGQENFIEDHLKGSIPPTLFLLDIRDIRGKERKEAIIQHFADEIEVVSSLPPEGPKVQEYLVREAIKNVYASLSDEIHQVGARFQGDEFILPRATPPITIADVYAYASIIKSFGFKVVYPKAENENCK